ncbi:glycosyltransferase [Flavobacterium aurantiibacter]|uniref:glycosyltransferase n=1 Tax=Flavobacterium aurantiibacter TaxID=2023067 RepID=UPI0026CEC662|nr:glycosyltransferase [Flavobacterium aurantiibacter]
MDIFFSIIVPVYNRQDELFEFLDSIAKTSFKEPFEVLVIDDGSSVDLSNVVHPFLEKLNLKYVKKANSGPGDSRNYGMRNATGNYFLIFDSDCIIPKDYLTTVSKSLKEEYVDCFGGPDDADQSFSKVQKAIDFVMTAPVTTGGIRGGSEKIIKFQPRSFNMGLSREAFLATDGFAKIHPGEDPELVFRLWKLGFKTKLIPTAKVCHKRRVDLDKFHLQVSKFGATRAILNKWYPEYAKPTFWLPTLFVVYTCFSVLISLLSTIPIFLLFVYSLLVLLSAIIKYRSLVIGFLAVKALYIMMFGYGIHFLETTLILLFSKKEPQELFPKLFFK